MSAAFLISDALDVGFTPALYSAGSSHVTCLSHVTLGQVVLGSAALRAACNAQPRPAISKLGVVSSAGFVVIVPAPSCMLTSW
jgi:hypothetical protein